MLVNLHRLMYDISMVKYFLLLRQGKILRRGPTEESPATCKPVSIELCVRVYVCACVCVATA